MRELSTDEADVLLRVADAAIVAGLHGRRPAPVDTASLPDALRAPRGVFVTLHVDGELNGCIGSIEGTEPLARAAARHAWAAAFADPRLPPLTRADYPRTSIEVSVLSPLTPVPATSRASLAAQLRPHADGLVLGDGHRRAVFLPAVWETLPDPDEFVDRLLRKGGFGPGWSPSLRAERFTAEVHARTPSSTARPR